VPGLGRTAAQDLIAEVGVDMSVFATPAHLLSWAKFCPQVEQSAGKTKGRNSRGRGNRYLAGVLGAGAGRWCWAVVLGGGAGRGCWAGVLGGGAGRGRRRVPARPRPSSAPATVPRQAPGQGQGPSGLRARHLLA
jgi:hypothetical protein